MGSLYLHYALALCRRPADGRTIKGARSWGLPVSDPNSSPHFPVPEAPVPFSPPFLHQKYKEGNTYTTVLHTRTPQHMPTPHLHAPPRAYHRRRYRRHFPFHLST